MGKVTNKIQDNVDNKIKNTIVVFVKTDGTCAPCDLIKEDIKTLDKEYQDNIVILDALAEQNKGVRVLLGVTSVPTVLVFKGRKQEVNHFSPSNQLGHYSGRGDLEDIKRMLEGTYPFADNSC